MNTRSFRNSLSCLFLVLASATVASAQEPAAKAPEVPVIRPVANVVTDYEEFTGRMEAPARVDLRARVTGYLLKVAFQDGAEVKEGEVLFEIDSRLYRAELDKAEAALVQAEARLKLAQANHKRAAAAFAQKVISQEEFDKTLAEQAETEAGVHVAKAVREVARLNLEFTRVHAPISGQIGRRLVDPGNLVKADETLLAVIAARDPMYVYFDIDERSFLRLRNSMREEKLKPAKMPVAIGLATEESFSHRGELDFVDNRVDPDTGTLRLRAVLPNKNRLLLPGMFVRVRVPIGKPYEVLLIPVQAVMVEDGAKFVFVVNDKNGIEKRPVVVGQSFDGSRVVKEGLKAEDWVVVGRLERLRPGTTVRPQQKKAPVPEPGRGSEGAGPFLAPPPRGQPGPGIFVEAVYPGANAQIVSDGVRAPIEQQVGSVEHLRFLRSRCSSDGRYALALSFGPGVDLKMMQVFVQNRVNLAMPQLPHAVRDTGVSFKRGTSGVLMIVNLFSPDSRYDSLYVSNYASIQIKDELARLPGVGDVTLSGRNDYGVRVWLDPDKLTARNLNAGEVVRMIEKQKEPGEADLEKLSDLILKAGVGGQVVRLRDVARVEIGVGRQPYLASLDGKPVVALVVHPTGEVRPQKLRAALRERLAEIRGRFPDGLDLDVTFDFTANLENPDRPATPEYLLLDVDTPAAASAERTLEILSRCQALLRQQPGVQHALVLSENPFDPFGNGPCILVRLTPAEQRKFGREEILRAIRARLDEIQEMTPRLRDLSGAGRFPRCGYPIDLAVRGPETGRVRDWASQLGERLRGSKRLTDVWVDPASTPRRQRIVEVDRTKAATLGVSVEEVLDALRVHEGSLNVNNFYRFGRAWRLEVQATAGDGANDLHKIKIRSAGGQMIPLGALATVREIEGSQVLDFLDSWPMVEITANPASGMSADAVRKLCETLAEEIRKELGLSTEYRLTWLEELPGPK